MVRKNTALKVLNVISFVAMIVVNALANILPLNNISTGEVSDFYPNLFAPAAVTFSIWIVIYFLLACFIVYQFVSIGGKKEEIIKRISPYLIISSLANAAWMFSWHYKNILLSIILMIIILISLGLIFFILGNTNLSNKEKVFIKLPFSIYFGWISVATIANIIVLLVSLGFNALSQGGQVLTVILILLATIVGIILVIRERNVFYGLVFIWAYIGIIIKHLSKSGFDGRYMPIVIISLIGIAAIVITDFYIILKNRTLM